RSLFDLMHALTRRFTGGAAIGATGACALFGSMTGSSAASAAALAPIIIPELGRLGYSQRMASGLTAAGGTLGIMLPPSVVFIIYGVLTSTSVASLFLAGIIPGLFMALLLALTCYVLAKRGGISETGKFDGPEVLRHLKQAFPSLLMPVIVLGGIYSGWFTPTEAAAISVVYALFVTIFVYRTLKWKDLPGILMES